MGRNILHHILPALCILLAGAAPSNADGGLGGWTDGRDAGVFLCRADFRLDDSEPLFQELAQLQEDLVQSLGIRPAAERIQIYLFRNQANHRRFLAARFPGVPYRRALYIKGDGPGMVFAFYGPQFDVDLRHECTHALLHAALPMVPLWLDEGIAEYFETARTQRASGHANLSGARWSSRFGVVPSLERLESKGQLTEMGAADYRAAWAWVHFMLHGPSQVRAELTSYLRDIQNGTPPGLLSSRLGRLDRQFAAHFVGWKRP